VCDLENLKNEEAMTRVGSQRQSIKERERQRERETQLYFPNQHNFVTGLFITANSWSIITTIPIICTYVRINIGNT